VPAFPDVDAEQARQIVHGYLAGQPGGGWLPPPDAAALLRAYRIPLAEDGTADGTAAVAGYPELHIGVQDDQMFGPLVVLGPGGAAAGADAGHAARLAPLTEADADALAGSVRSAAPLHAHPGITPDGLTALRDMLLRVSRLSDDLPEVIELDLNPVATRPDGAVAAGARIQVVPQAAQDPFLRRLR
jgi:hypothetical protein